MFIRSDYLFFGQSDSDNEYAFVVEDDLSGYIWPEHSPTADSKHTKAILSRWTCTFTAPDV